jgi:hypothetical protein
MQTRIPKRIIQTGKSLQAPLLQRAAMASVRNLNPDFEYLFFDDNQVEKFLQEESPEHQAVAAAFPYRIQRYDFFRYLAVYRYGGFYFDLDVILASGLSNLLGHRAVFSFEDITLSRYMRRAFGIDWSIGNYAFGCEAGHPFLRAVIENCVRAQRDASWLPAMMQGIPKVSRREFEILNTTGPLLLCRTLAENPALAETITILFPDDVCEPRNWHNFGDLGVHLMEGTWREEGASLWERLSRNLEARTFRRFLRESRQLGKTRRFPPVPQPK